MVGSAQTDRRSCRVDSCRQASSRANYNRHQHRMHHHMYSCRCHRNKLDDWMGNRSRRSTRDDIRCTASQCNPWDIRKRRDVQRLSCRWRLCRTAGKRARTCSCCRCRVRCNRHRVRIRADSR